MQRLLVLMITLLGFTACQNDTIFEQVVKPEAETWLYHTPAEFDFSIQDTSIRYDFLLDIKHSEDYPFQNLYTKIKTSFPDATTQEDVVSLELADKLGLWEGKCRAGYCFLTIALQEGARFALLGDYSLDFEQFTRTDSLPGVAELTLRITPSN